MNWTYFVAFVVGVLGAARLTRLVTEDDFPPMMAMRDAVDNRLPAKWAKLVHCPFCFGFWAALLNLTAAWFSELHPVWWFINLAFGSSYIVAWLVFNDMGIVLVHENKDHNH